MKGKYLWSSGNVWRAENAFDDRRGFFSRPTSVAEINVRDTNFIMDLASCVGVDVIAMRYS